MRLIWGEMARALCDLKDELTARLHRVKEQEQELEERLARYVKVVDEGVLSKFVCAERTGVLTSKLDELQREGAVLADRLDRACLPQFHEEGITRCVDTLREILKGRRGIKKCQALRMLMARVVVRSPEKIDIWYRLPELQRLRKLSRANAGFYTLMEQLRRSYIGATFMISYSASYRARHGQRAALIQVGEDHCSTASRLTRVPDREPALCRLLRCMKARRESRAASRQ